MALLTWVVMFVAWSLVLYGVTELVLTVLDVTNERARAAVQLVLWVAMMVWLNWR